MQYKASHKQQLTLGETALGWLGIALAVAAIYALVETWPWWLLLLPFFFLWTFRSIDKPIETLRKSFAAETGDPETHKAQKAIIRSSLWFGILSGWICFTKDVQLHNLGWALAPLISICLSYRLRSLAPPAKRWPKLRSALYSNLFELLAIAVIVLSIYSALLWWLHSLPLNDVTLETLKDWDERVQKIHEFLETHTPKFAAYLVALVFTLALRLVATVRPQLLGMAKATSEAIIQTSKWLERVSTAIAIAASLTFLATGEGGPASQIGITLRTANEEYANFQRAVEHRVDDLLRQKILQKAWSQRPATVNVAATQSAYFVKERGKFDQLREKAHRLYQISIPDVEGFPVTVALDTPKPRLKNVGETPASSWTPAQIHKAAEDPSLSQEDSPTVLPEEEDPKDEMSKKVFEELLPKDYLFDHTPGIAILKAHFPVFGELLDAITSSISEASFDSLRELITQRIVQRKIQRNDVSVEQMVSTEARDSGRTFRVDFVRFNAGWEKSREIQLRGYLVAIMRADASLREKANEQKMRDIAKAKQDLSARQVLLRKVGHILGSKSTTDDARDVEARMLKLEALAKRWPALDEPDERLESQLRSIGEKSVPEGERLDFRPALSHTKSLIEGLGLPPSEKKFVPPSSRSSGNLSQWQQSVDQSQVRRQAQSNQQVPDLISAAIVATIGPLDRMRSLTSYCDSLLTNVVAENYNSDHQTAALRAVMASEYATYYKSWQRELAHAEEMRQMKIQREREETRRFEEAQARERARETIVREHPIEIP